MLCFLCYLLKRDDNQIVFQLKEFVMFEKNLQKLTELASKLPQDQCDHDIEPTSFPTPENITSIYNSTDNLSTVRVLQYCSVPL